MTDTRGSAFPVGPTSRRRLIEAAQRGDKRAQNALVGSFEPLVQRVVWKLRLPEYVEREDLAQEARLGLVSAIRAWRPERGPFPAFADRCVRNQALLALTAACARKHQVLSLAVPIETDRARVTPSARDQPPADLLEVLYERQDAHYDPEARLLVNEELTCVVRALPALTANERAALTGALNGQSHEQLAPVIGGTRKSASQAVLRARRKLAAALPKAA